MIKSFRHKGIQKFFETGSEARIQPKRAVRLNTQLTGPGYCAGTPEKMNVAGWHWHPLGELAGLWAVSVNGNWRLTFGFEGDDAILVDYQDYH